MSHRGKSLTILLIAALIGVISASAVLAQDAGPQPAPADSIGKAYLPIAMRGAAATPTPTRTVTRTPAPGTATPSPTPGPSPTPPPAGSVDLSILSMEFTQGIQTDQNSVPLVANRATMARVYAQVNGATSVANVSVAITAKRNGATLPGSPLVIGPRAVPASPSRSIIDTSFNAPLPAAWLDGQTTFEVVVDSAGAINEANEGNNTAAAVLTFEAVAPLQVVIVPIRYTHTPNGQVYPPPTVDTVGPAVLKLFPVPSVAVEFHAPIDFSGDLRSSGPWSTLLNQVTSLRQSEVGSTSPKVYYGLVPVQNSSGRWFSSGIAGIGWLGGTRASVGLDLGVVSGGFIAAHEIGHNLGRAHAPCGNPSGADTSFPYPGASIGQIGFDVAAQRVWSPGSPDNAKDLMSYCNPQWISDYTYRAIFTRLRSGALSQVQTVAMPSDGLLVRADVSEPETAAIQPAYALSRVLVDADAGGEYEVQVLDAGGNVLLAQAASAFEASAHNRVGRRAGQDAAAPVVRSIQAIMPRPPSSAASIRILRGEAVIAERALAQGQPAVAPSAALGADGVLRWAPADRPALVRITVDGGATWTTLAIDVLGGALPIDLSALPPGTPQFEVVLADAMP